MTYEETVDYLFNCAPPFQQVGGAAYKEGLDNSIALDDHAGNPHRKFRSIHVAGTNGKGSCSHTLAATLQAAGYKVGLYTSPHLIDFRERIRVNGVPASKEFVVEWVKNERPFFEPLCPSFFELTTAMAFSYFAREAVDVAVIEVGLGGRLDCTNIIAPDLCIITNISPDHVQFLGNSLASIAGEKAGIIKPGTPVVIGETTPETHEIFAQKAAQEQAPIIFAEENSLIKNATPTSSGYRYETTLFGTIDGELGGDYQVKNANTILNALMRLIGLGYNISDESIKKGFSSVCATTGLMGRWQILGTEPKTVCDAGHNIGGIKYIVNQLKREKYATLRIVFGMVNDKEIDEVLAMMPQEATYYFTQASIRRALPAEQMKEKAATHGLVGTHHPTVGEALQAARIDASPDDLIFIGGSCFIVADLLQEMR